MAAKKKAAPKKAMSPPDDSAGCTCGWVPDPMAIGGTEAQPIIEEFNATCPLHAIPLETE